MQPLAPQGLPPVRRLPVRCARRHATGAWRLRHSHRLHAALSLTISFAVLFAALLHASWNAMIKGGGDVLLDTAAFVAGAGLVALPFIFVVPVPAVESWP